MTLPNINLTALSENATRFGMRLQESISERTRGLSLQGLAGRGIGTSLGSLELTEEKNGTIKKQLEEGGDREKLDAMRKLVALMPKYPTTHPHFASVVKLVSSPNIEIRKLVYIFLLQYSAHHPDLALLAVNGLKREMAGENVGAASAAGGVGGYAAAVAMRGWAVRVLCGMALGVAGVKRRGAGGVIGGTGGAEGGGGGGGLTPLVRLAIGKCVKDGNVYVRKVGALALIKCYELEPTHESNLSTLSTLLSDPSPLVIGSVLYTFTQISPTRYDLLHKHFRRICKVLVEMDDWGQVVSLGVLARYGRVMLRRPSWREGKGEEGSEEVEEIDSDLKLLLDSVKPVLQSRNPAVVVAATHVLYYLGPPSWPIFVPHLLRLLTGSREVERVVLADLLIISKKDPDLLSSYYTRFLVRCDDLSEVKKDKIRLMLNVVNDENWPAILREFIDYAEDVDDSAVEEAIGAVGSIATRISQKECMSQCLTALIMMIKSRYDVVVSCAVMVLKRLVQVQLAGATTQQSGTGHSPLEIVAHLARRIDDIKHPQARACVIWLVGQYAGVEVGAGTGRIAPSAPDVLRKLAKSFVGESSLVKLQVVSLAGKLVVLCDDVEAGGVSVDSVQEKIGMLARYVFSLARYDKDWDVRDRGRLVGALVGGFIGASRVEENSKERVGVVLRREQVKVVLFEGKQVGKDLRQSLDEEGVGVVGSFGKVRRGGGISYFGEEVLPDWLERGVESGLRDVDEGEGEGGVALSGFGSGGVGKGLALQVPEKVVLVPSGGSGSGTSTPAGSLRGPWTNLDAFYGNNNDREEDEEEDDEDEDEEESEEEDSDDE